MFQRPRDIFDIVIQAKDLDMPLLWMPSSLTHTDNRYDYNDYCH